MKVSSVTALSDCATPCRSVLSPEKADANARREAIGLFGGSFNPIHNGHVALAQAMCRRYQLDEVWLMISPQNPLKQESELLDDALRLEMARLALTGIDGVKACDYEFHLPKPSYTWHTLQALSHDYPDKTFTLLIGGDNWSHFERWYRWKDILRHHRVCVYPRRSLRDSSEPSFPNQPASSDKLTTDEDFPLIDISSTDIRRRISEGRSVSGLVPEAVARFIEEHGLYGSPTGEAVQCHENKNNSTTKTADNE